MLLRDLMEKHKCSKMEHPWYAKAYKEQLEYIREEVKTVLEIGVQSGSSLRVWAEYFPFAQIHGIDIREKCKQHESERIKVFIGDQEDKDFLKGFKGYDIIIDDGGHTMKQQRRSFQILFPLLSEHGIYVIEDLHTSYWPEFGGEHLGKKTTITMLKSLVDNLNAVWFKRSERARTAKMELGYLDNHIKSIHFYKSLCFICKV